MLDLLRHAQTARQHGELQEIVGLQRLPEQTADERHHLTIVTVLERLVQRYVVFVDQQNDLLRKYKAQIGRTENMAYYAPGDYSTSHKSGHSFTAGV